MAFDLDGQISRNDVCVACGAGVFSATPLFLDGECVAACPADKPLVHDGACVASCPTMAGAKGVACSDALPFVEGGQCVARPLGPTGLAFLAPDRDVGVMVHRQSTGNAAPLGPRP